MTKWECGLEMIILGALHNHQLTSKIWTYVLNRYRYEYATEYMQVMKDLWTKGRSDFKGSISPWKIADYCHCLPLTSSLLLRTRYVKRQLNSFAFSTKCFLDKRGLLTPCPGRAFAAKYCDYNFTSGAGVNKPTALKEANSRLVEAPKIEDVMLGHAYYS
jgi:pyrimidine oxygenase